ncbi:MAG: hypothetical protein KF708_07315 [Pirellulales bacterium]|nr:hypothetical protein [Pirellulales bacterium]
MGRNYAGVLGLLAFFTVLARGLTHGASAEGMVQSAATALVIFAAAGYVIGSLAAWNVEQSIRAQLADEVARLAASPTGTTKS